MGKISKGFGDKGEGVGKAPGLAKKRVPKKRKGVSIAKQPTGLEPQTGSLSSQPPRFPEPIQRVASFAQKGDLVFTWEDASIRLPGKAYPGYVSYIQDNGLRGVHQYGFKVKLFPVTSIYASWEECAAHRELTLEEVTPPLYGAGKTAFEKRYKEWETVQRVRDVTGESGHPLPPPEREQDDDDEIAESCAEDEVGDRMREIAKFTPNEVQAQVRKGCHGIVDKILKKCEEDVLAEGKEFTTASILLKFKETWEQKWLTDEGHSLATKARELGRKFATTNEFLKENKVRLSNIKGIPAELFRASAIEECSFCFIDGVPRKFAKNNGLTVHAMATHIAHEYLFFCGINDCRYKVYEFCRLRQHWRSPKHKLTAAEVEGRKGAQYRKRIDTDI